MPATPDDSPHQNPGDPVSSAGLDAATLDAVRTLVDQAQRPVVLTGAGMSAESGVPTFRDAQTGLWERFSPQELATEEAFRADPALVWSWYRWRARMIRACEPNAGHRALAAWQRRLDAADGTAGSAEASLHVVTQNVDDLHERAGARVLAHVHGSLFEHRCAVCDTPAEHDPGVADEGAAGSEADLAAMLRHEPPACPRCPDGALRPGVVWFGEMLPAGPWERAVDAVERADLVLVVGTSSLVQPAASLPLLALEAGVPVVEVNPERTELSPHVTHRLAGTAARVLPALTGAEATGGTA